MFAIAYLNRLFAVAYDGSDWSAPQELETGGDVAWADAYAVEPDRALVVWSTGDTVDAPVDYALLDANLCSYCGPGETCVLGTCMASESDYEQEAVEPVDAAGDAEARDAGPDDGSMADGDASLPPDCSQDPAQDGLPEDGVTEGGCGCSIHG